MDVYIAVLTFINDNIGLILIGMVMGVVFTMMEKAPPTDDPDFLEEALDTRNKELLSRGAIHVRLEEINDVLFLYNDLTDEFICQGSTVEEINEKFGIRFPGVSSMTVTGDTDLLARSYKVTSND